MGRNKMSPTGSTGAQRVAVYLLVVCLASVAVFHFASQALPRTAGAPEQIPGVSAPGGEIALVLGDRTEHPVNPELQSAVFRQRDCWRFSDSYGDPLPRSKESIYAILFVSATEIRGPPPTPQG